MEVGGDSKEREGGFRPPEFLIPILPMFSPVKESLPFFAFVLLVAVGEPKQTQPVL